MESGHLAVALDAEPTPGILRVDDVHKLRPEAGGAHEASVNVVMCRVLAAIVASNPARIDDADALRHGLRDVLPKCSAIDRDFGETRKFGRHNIFFAE